MTSLAMLSPGYGHARDWIDYFRWTQKGIEQLTLAKNLAVKFDYSHLLCKVRDEIKAHLYRTAPRVTNGIVFLAPGLVTGPTPWSMGFCSAGPVAAYQATVGNIPASSLFAYLESAGAAGYGAAGVNAVARASAILSEAILLSARQEKAVRKEMEGSLGGVKPEGAW
ncbi:MAG: hypothetical protein M1839_006439 [Geoglossum umbratile]|nr:MAG: hypothetical protein M1839_006439 [Geoglossum umbratile]